MFWLFVNIALSIWGKTLNYQICLSVFNLGLRISKVPGIAWFPSFFYVCHSTSWICITSPVSPPQSGFSPGKPLLLASPLASWGPGFGRPQVGLCTVEESYPGEQVTGPSMFWLWTRGHFTTMTPPSQQNNINFQKYLSLSWMLLCNGAETGTITVWLVHFPYHHVNTFV